MAESVQQKLQVLSSWKKTFWFEKTEVFYLTASSFEFSWKPGMRNFIDVDLWGKTLPLEVSCTKHLNHLSFSENLKSFRQNQSGWWTRTSNLQATQDHGGNCNHRSHVFLKRFRCSLLLFNRYAQSTCHRAFWEVEKEVPLDDQLRQISRQR